MHDEQTSMIDEEGMKLLVDELYTKGKLCTWTSIELHDKNVSGVGQVTRQQMLTKLVAHLGDDVMVLCIEDCAVIVGFRELVHKIVKIAKLNTGSGERGCLGEKDPTDVCGIPSNSKNFYLGDFIHVSALSQSSYQMVKSQKHH